MKIELTGPTCPKWVTVAPSGELANNGYCCDCWAPSISRTKKGAYGAPQDSVCRVSRVVIEYEADTPPEEDKP